MAIGGMCLSMALLGWVVQLHPAAPHGASHPPTRVIFGDRRGAAVDAGPLATIPTGGGLRHLVSQILASVVMLREVLGVAAVPDITRWWRRSNRDVSGPMSRACGAGG